MTDSKRKMVADEEDFDLKKLIARFLSHWILYAVTLVLCIVAGLLFIRYSTPMYKVQAKVLVQDDQNSSGASSFMGGSAMQDFGDLFGIKSNVANELGILQTADLMEKVVVDMNLAVTYFKKGRVRAVEMYTKSPFNVKFISLKDTTAAANVNLSFHQLGADDKINISSEEIVFPATAAFGDTVKTDIGLFIINRTGTAFEDTEYFFTLAPTDEVVTGITDNLTIDITNDETTIITLSYNSSVPKKGQDILQNLIDAYIDRNLKEKNKISDSTIAFIDGRISIVSKELNDIEAEIQGFKQKNKIADISEQSKALISNSSIYNDKRNEADVQLSVINAMLSSIQTDAKRPVPSLINNDPTFLALVEKYNTLLLQRERLLLSTTESNPLVNNADIQLTGIRGDMIKSLQNQQKAIQIGIDRIRSENALLSNMVSNVPVQERKYVDLSRERDVKQALYLFLLQQNEQTAITKAANMPSAGIIETPKSEFKPYYPANAMVLATCILLALIIPTGWIIIKYTLNNKIISRDDITQATDCSIMAEIGHSDQSGILMEKTSRSPIAEQFRVFRTNMDFVTGQKKCPKLMITSTIPGEGKSFIAANLAQVYAYSDKKVLLMELDLRKPKLSSMLGVPNTIGFTNYIIKKDNVLNYIQPVPQSTNVFVMSSGPLPPNPAELLMLDALGKMFEELTSHFDVIIMDSPPVGLVIDAQILSKHSDANLYIIRQQYSFKTSLETINDIVDKNKFANLYLVVNDIKRSSYRYGYGDGYGYGYGDGYGYGYAESKPEKKKFFKPKILK